MSTSSFAAAYAPYGRGKKAGVGALADSALAARVQKYKRQVAKRYRVAEPERIDELLPDESMFISAKLDGELWFLVKQHDEVALVAENGRVLLGITALVGVETLLAGVEQVVIAGELVEDDGQKDRARVYHTSTALTEPAREATLRFFAFDLVELDGKDEQLTPYVERLAWLEATLGKESDGRVGVVATTRGVRRDVRKRFDEWVVEGGAEGLVVRTELGATFKIKPTKSIDVVVVAFGERLVEGRAVVRELQIALVRDDGSYQLVGSVGTGFSEADRVTWHDRLSEIVVPSSFRLANREGTLCRFVAPRVIIEVRVSDFITTDSWDAPIRRMSLRYDEATGYAPIAEMLSAVPLHPVFVRERTDKRHDIGHVGMTQLSSHLDAHDASKERTDTSTKAADVVRRGVYVKETKGQKAVRKFVVLETHRSGEAGAPFIVFFTDFSPGRQEPLKTSLRPARTRAETDTHVDRWLTENVKRGWAPVGE